MSNVTQVPQGPQTPSQEIGNLFAQKGELVTQIEIAQSKLNLVNQRLSGLLSTNQPVA